MKKVLFVLAVVVTLGTLSVSVGQKISQEVPTGFKPVAQEVPTGYKVAEEVPTGYTPTSA